MHAGEVLARELGIARIFRAAGEQHGVELVVQRGEGLGDADIDAAMEDDAFGFHLLHAPVDMVLLHLEVGNAVAQQAAGLRLALKDVHVMADAGELLRGGEARRARADDRDALAGQLRRRLRLDPAFSQALSAIACSIVLMVTGCSRG